MPLRPTVLWLTLLTLTPLSAPAAWAGEDDYVRWSLVTPAPSPYHTIRYEITRRRPATTAVHRRNLPGLDESLHALGLLTPEESEAAFSAIRAADALSLPDAPAPAKVGPGTLTWQCDIRLDGTSRKIVVAEPLTQPDRRYAALFATVRDLVLLRAGPLPFRNVFFPSDERGWINIESVPAARVFVDGLDTELDTPLYAYEVAAGTHTIRLVDKEGQLDRTYSVKIEAQGTTTLRVDLR
ncbi:MAG: hypothetical protein IT385_30355 [Deltaproteobacteria bacterium]|nr:hypothetical protein [Deltaproteobacteria bacterium]